MRQIRLAVLVVIGVLAAFNGGTASASGSTASSNRLNPPGLAAKWSPEPGVTGARQGGAKKPAVELPSELRGGEATTHVYLGVRNGKAVYVGITNDLARRQAQHGGRFVLVSITESPVTRGEARAIEQALMVRNPGFENIRNSISPKHPWYREAVAWGEAWLHANRL